MSARFIHYKVAVPFLDAEHLALMDCIEKSCLNIKNSKYDLARENIKELYVLLDTHFRHEEQFMIDNSFPYYIYHVEDHAKILLHTHELLEQKDITLTLHLLMTLENAVFGHIDSHDMIYAAFCKGNPSLIIRDYS
jgi:hemerythrin-like metal-binding protein